MAANLQRILLLDLYGHSYGHEPVSPGTIHLMMRERRKARRFPMAAEVLFEVLNRGGATASPTLAGRGQSINISRCGVLFTTDADIPLQAAIRICILFQLPDREQGPLLIGEGRVVRRQNGQVAIELLRHQLRAAESKLASSAAFQEN
jgi:hypothetical protein